MLTGGALIRLARIRSSPSGAVRVTRPGPGRRPASPMRKPHYPPTLRWTGRCRPTPRARPPRSRGRRGVRRAPPGRCMSETAIPQRVAERAELRESSCGSSASVPPPDARATKAVRRAVEPPGLGPHPRVTGQGRVAVDHGQAPRSSVAVEQKASIRLGHRGDGVKRAPRPPSTGQGPGERRRSACPRDRVDVPRTRLPPSSRTPPAPRPSAERVGPGGSSAQDLAGQHVSPSPRPR